MAAGLMLLWPLILAAPQFATGERSRIAFLGVAAAVVGVLAAVRLAEVIAAGRRMELRWATVSLSVFVVLTGLSVARAPDSLMDPTSRVGAAGSMVLMLLVSTLAATGQSKRSASELLLNALLLSIPLFLVVNLAILFSPVAVTASPLRPDNLASTNQLLGTLDVRLPRITALPGINGSNVIGLLAGIGTLICAHFICVTRALRPAFLILLLANSAVLILADTRSAVLLASLSTALYLLSGASLLSRIVKLALVLSVLSSFVATLAFNLLGQVGLSDFLIRQAGMGRSLGVGGGRMQIWEVGLSRLLEFKVDHVFGYGYGSQIETGMVNQYVWIFREVIDRASLHNTFLQQVFDMGYVGAAAFFLCTWSVCGALARGSSGASDRLARCSLAILGYIVVSGYTEATATMFHFELLLFLIGLSGLSAPIWRDQHTAPIRSPTPGRTGSPALTVDSGARQ